MGRATHHRYGIVVSGPASWGRRIAAEGLEALSAEQTLWVGRAKFEGARSVTADAASKFLGAEFEALVYDAHDGFDPDAFGATTGTLVGGGLLILLTPPLSSWPRFPDPDYARMVPAGFRMEDVAGRFLERLVGIMEASSAVFVVEPGRQTVVAASKSLIAVGGESDDEPDSTPCRTRDQLRAVNAILEVATGRAGRPLVLIADRGRGKSAALGIASAGLLQSGLAQIVVTAPRLDAAAPVFRHAAALLPGAKVTAGKVQWHTAEIVFVPPDALVHGDHTPRLLLVDEAAAIPGPMLMRLLQKHGRIVFSTTVNGYEGSGRGFALRFKAELERRRPDGQSQRLEAPIRWAANDPLEGFVSEALLLDATPAVETAVASANPASCEIREMDRDHLARNDRLLGELFGLLVGAHYRTRPSDLRNLLDGPGVRVFAMTHSAHVVATALLGIEGGFDRMTAQAIWAGGRRPRGHLLAQSLCAHAGIEEAATRRVARIMRIAVHPELQRRGLGQALTRYLAEAARGLGCDLIGACFGATSELLDFWENSGVMPVQMGMTRSAVSGSHSVTVVAALSEPGARIHARARRRFASQIAVLLGDPLRDLEPAIAARVLRAKEAPAEVRLSLEDWCDLIGFAFAARGFELTLGPVWRLVTRVLARSESEALVDTRQRALLIARVLQKRSWGDAAQVSGYTGRAQALAAMRETLRRLLLEYADEAARELIPSRRYPSETHP